MKMKMTAKAMPAAKRATAKPHIRMRKVKPVPPSAFPPSPMAFPPSAAGPPGPDAAMGAPPAGPMTGAGPGMLGS